MVPSVFIIVLEIPFMFIPPFSEYFIPGCRLDLLITERSAPVSNKNVGLFSLPKLTLSCIVSRLIWCGFYIHEFWRANYLLFLGLGSSWVAQKLPTFVSRLGPTNSFDPTINLCVAFHAAFSAYWSLSAILSDVTFTSTIKTTHNLSYFSKLINFIYSRAWVWGNFSLLLHLLAMWPNFLHLYLKRGPVAPDFFLHGEYGAFLLERDFDCLR